MTTGKAVPKLVPSFARRRLRLGVSHHGAASRWAAPAKDAPPAETSEPARPPKKKR